MLFHPFPEINYSVHDQCYLRSEERGYWAESQTPKLWHLLVILNICRQKTNAKVGGWAAVFPLPLVLVVFQWGASWLQR